jgi:hypothetical protein
MLDSNDHMVDTCGMGYTERRKINEEIIHERTSYQDGFRTMVESVKRPFKEMEELVRRGESRAQRSSKKRARGRSGARGRSSRERSEAAARRR